MEDCNSSEDSKSPTYRPKRQLIVEESKSNDHYCPKSQLQPQNKAQEEERKAPVAIRKRTSDLKLSSRDDQIGLRCGSSDGSHGELTEADFGEGIKSSMPDKFPW